MAAPSDYDPNVSVSRVFDVPRPVVFDAWTQPKHLEQWFAPRPYTLPACEIDLRVGGLWRYTMRSPEGAEHTVTATYRQIVVPELLVLTTGFADLPGLEFEQRVTFVERGAGTEVTFAMRFPPAAQLTAAQLALLAPRALGARQGSAMTLAQLAEVLAR